jgi:tRNA threonylcarbamoyladenosine biosynthesis protein TsaB
MIVGLKTSSDVTEFSLFDSVASKKAKAVTSWESKRELSEQLLGRLTNFLHDNHLDLEDLKGFIIFSGPGSFTSLRIGHTVLNALADSLGIPVAGAKDPGWQHSALNALKTARPGTPALPFYGAEAHITRPKS